MMLSAVFLLVLIRQDGVFGLHSVRYCTCRWRESV